MAHAGHDQRHTIGLAVGHRIFVTDRASRLYYRSNTGFMGHFHAIIERKKCIGGQHSAAEVETKSLCFFKRMPERIYPTGLAASLTQQLPVFH